VGMRTAAFHRVRARTGRGYVWRMGIRVLAPPTGDAGAPAVMVAADQSGRDEPDAALARSRRFATPQRWAAATKRT